MWKWLQRLAGTSVAIDERSANLYAAIVVRARAPFWYRDGGVADDVDGRFDMILLVLSLYIVRLERDDADPAARMMSSALIERFVADIDGSFREIGIGDMVIGKHMGRALQALGGRLGSYRDALADDAPADRLAAALGRNLYRGRPLEDVPLAIVETAVRADWHALLAMPLKDLTA